MNDARISKSVFYTLCRGGLICLLFLMPWLAGSNLHAQSLGVVGIDPGASQATLKILDDDNMNNNSTTVEKDSWNRRTVKLVQTVPSATEGNPLKFKLAFTNNQTTAVQDVIVTYKLVNGTAEGSAGSDKDYVADVGVEKTITIPAGQNESAEVSIPTIDDNIIEGNETFCVHLVKAETPTAAPIPSREDESQATKFAVNNNSGSGYEFTIVDNDNTPTNLTLSFIPTSYSITEGTGAAAKDSVKVKLGGGVAGEDIFVPYILAGSTATYNTDYTIAANGGTTSAVGGTIKIPKGTSEGYFVITATPDNIIEPSELVSIQGTAVSSGLGLTYTWNTLAQNANIEIKDATGVDPNKLKLTLTATTPVSEGGSSTIRVSLPSGITSSQNIVVGLDLSGTATVGTDYDFTGASLSGSRVTATILAGEEYVEFTLDAKTDNIIEGPETAILTGATASGVAGYTYTFASAATVTINDATGVDPNKLKLTLTATTPVSEGGSSTIRVSLPSGITSSQNIVVGLDLSGTATVGTDYDFTGASLSGSRVTATILAGEEYVEFTLDAKTDNIIEGPETAILTGATASGGAGYTYTFANTTATVTINDATGVDPNKLKLTLTATTPVSEGGSSTIRVSLPSGITSSEDIDVELEMSGTATVGTDYDFTGASLSGSRVTATILAGEEYVEFTLDAKTDNIIEGPETAILTGATASGGAGYTYTFANTATVTINDVVDPDKAKLTIKANPASPTGILEGTEASTITVGFKDPNIKTVAPLSVTISLAGTATAGSDYEFKLGSTSIPISSNEITVTIPDNANKVDFQLLAKDDDIIELAETAILKGEAVTGFTWDVDEASVTISDRTGSITGNNLIKIVPNTGNVQEDNNIDVTVSLDKESIKLDAGAYIDVPLKVSGTATHTADYTLDKTIYPNGTVRIAGDAAGNNKVTVKLSAVADGIAEAPETVVIEPNGAPTSNAGTYAWSADATKNKSTITIEDVSDANALKLIVDLDKTTIKKGEAVTATIRTANGAMLAKDVKVNLAAAGSSTAVAVTDYDEWSSPITLLNTTASVNNSIQSGCNDAGEKKLVLSASINDNAGIVGLSVEFGANGNTITIEDIGVSSISGSTETCHNEEVTLSVTAPAGSTYQWKDGSTVVGSAATYVLPDNATVGTHSITVTVTTPQGCVVTRSHNVEVKHRHDAFTVATATASVCGNTEATITSGLTANTSYTYRWWKQRDGGAAEPVTTGTGATTPTLKINETTPGTYTYWLVITHNTSACERISTNTVTVEFIDGANIPKPTLKVVPAGGSLCGGGATLEALYNNNTEHYAAGTKFEWYKDGVTSAHKIAGEEDAILHVTASGNYYVIAYVGACPSSISDYAEIVGSAGTSVPQPQITPSATPAEVCGDVLELTVTIPTNLSGYEVRWYNEDGYIAAAGNAKTYAAPANGKTYSVILIDGACASIESNKVTVSKATGTITVDKPEVKRTPADGVGVCGGAVVLEVTNHLSGGSPDPNVSFQWYKVGTGTGDGLLSGETQRTLVVTGSSATGDEYYVVAKKSNPGCGEAVSLASDYKKVTIAATYTGALANAKLETDVAGNVLCANGSIVLRVKELDATNNVVGPYPTANVVFDWYYNGAFKETTSGNTLPATAAGDYFVVVRKTANGCVGDQKVSDNLTVVDGTPVGGNLEQPAITKDVTSGACGNGAVTLYITNIKTGVAYRWYYNNNEIADADGGNRTYYNATAAGSYYVIASDGTCSSKPSSTEAVTLGSGNTAPNAPQIAVNPASGMLCTGGSVTLYVVNHADYDTDTKFQWFAKNGGPVVGVGMDQPIIVLPNGTFGADEYTAVAIKGSCKSMESNAVDVTMGGTASLSKPVLSASNNSELCAGGSVTLTVTNHSDYTNPTYTWYSYTIAAGHVQVHTGTAPVYHATTAGKYYVAITAGGCNISSELITVTESGSTVAPNDTPKIISPSGSFFMCAGGSLDLKAVKQDNTEYPAGTKFVWFYNGSQLTASDKTGSLINVTDFGRYTVKVILGGCETAPSAEVEVQDAGSTISIIPTIDKYPSVEVCINGTVQLTATLVSGAKYQWYWRANQSDPLQYYGALSAAGANSVNVPYAKSGYYSVAIHDGSCISVVSHEVQVIQGSCVALDKPKIEHDGMTICFGGSLQLKAVQQDGSDYPAGTTFKWYTNNGTIEIVGATNAIYQAEAAGTYTVKAVVSGQESAESDAVTLAVGPTTSPAPAQPYVKASSTELCINGSVTLTAHTDAACTVAYPNATGRQFLWYKNGELVGTTSYNIFHYTWQAEDADYSTYTFTVKVKEGGCESKESSNAVTLSKGGQVTSAKPTLTASADGVGCINGMVTLSVDMRGTSYEWYKVGSPTPVVTHVPMHNVAVTATDEYYYVVVRDGSCSLQPSDSKKVSNNGSTAPNVTLTIAGGGTTICSGGTAILTATGASSTADYRWFIRYTADNSYEVKDIDGANTLFLDNTGKGNMEVTVALRDGDCLSQESNTVQVLVNTSAVVEKPTIQSDWSGDYCAGTKIILKAVTTDASVTQYVWYRNNIEVQSGASDTYYATAAGTYRVLAKGTCLAASAEYTINEATDPSCLAAKVKLVVDKDVIDEGDQLNISATLPDGLVANGQIDIDFFLEIGDHSDNTANKVNACAPLGSSLGKDDFRVTSTTLTILGNAQTSSTSIVMAACNDNVYEGKEYIHLVAKTRANAAPVSNSGLKITIVDLDADPDGKLNLIWELVPTTHSATGLSGVIYKGEYADFKVIALAPDGVTPVRVQDDVTVAIAVNPISTAANVIAYSSYTSATIPAGGQDVVIRVSTTDDKVAETDREFFTNIRAIQPELQSVQHSTEQILYIRSKDVNPLGGFDFEVALSPANVMEGTGDSFKLTVSLVSSDPATTLGSPVAFSLTELASSIAKLGVDYSMPTEVVVAAGTNKTVLDIGVIDNTLFDGNRRMDIDATPKESKDRILAKTPNPLSGIIENDDKLCITLTSDKKGIDELEKTATITIEAHNLSPIVGSVILQLVNTNTSATHYNVPVNEFSVPITLTANPVNPKLKHEFRITSSLVPSGISKEDFDISTYVSVYEELLITIEPTLSNVSLADLECFEPLTLIISDDFDQDGLPNWIERKDPSCPEDTGDSNNNGIPNEWDPYDPNADDDGDGIPNWMEDTNRDGNPYNDFAGSSCLPNFANLDSDGDGVPDEVEGWSDRPYDNNEEDIRIHPALSLNDDGIGNDKLYIENIHKYPNKVTVFDRQGIVVWEEVDYRNDSEKAFKGISKKTKKKVPMGTYFVIVEYTKGGAKKYYDKAVEVRY